MKQVNNIYHWAAFNIRRRIKWFPMVNLWIRDGFESIGFNVGIIRGEFPFWNNYLLINIDLAYIHLSIAFKWKDKKYDVKKDPLT